MRACAAHDKLGVTAVWAGNTDVEEKHEVIRFDQEAFSALERNGVRVLAAGQHLAKLGNCALRQPADLEETALVRATIANDPGREYAGQLVANIHGCLCLQEIRLWIQSGCPSVRNRTLRMCSGKMRHLPPPVRW